MAFSKLNGDEAGIIFGQLCNVFEPNVAVAFSSANSGLWALTRALRQQLRAEYEAAVAVCYKLGVWPCKEMREATRIEWISNDISATDLTTLGTLGSVLPALDQLVLIDSSGHCSAAGFDGVQRLAAGLGAGALPSVSLLCLTNMHAGEAGASALAAALGRGALPRLEALILINAGIGDAGLVALAPVLRRLPALKFLFLSQNPLGDEGLAALVAPPPPASALSPSTGVLTKLELLGLSLTQVSDVGCAALAAVLDGGALLALETLKLYGIPASAAAKAAVYEARDKLQGSESDSESEEEDEE
eukprot:scaffold46915_cov60-Phaeocystis_antarctica.AAC.1